MSLHVANEEKKQHSFKEKENIRRQIKTDCAMATAWICILC